MPPRNIVGVWNDWETHRAKDWKMERWEDAPRGGGARCDPGFAGRTPASGAGPLYRESTFRATPADRVREQALLDRQAARDKTAMRLYIGLACLTLAGLVASILWYFGIIQRWHATYTG